MKGKIKMSCWNKPEHKWGRHAAAISLYGTGRRVIESCDDCLAIRISFHIHMLDGSEQVETVVVEHNNFPDWKPTWMRKGMK